MAKSHLRLYLSGLKIITAPLLLGLPVAIWYGIFVGSYTVDRFIGPKTTPYITELEYLRKTYPEYNDLDNTTLVELVAQEAHSSPRNLLLIEYEGIDKRFANNNLLLMRESEYSESIWLWLIIIIAIPLCFSLYFPVISIVIRRIKKSVSELKNE